MVKFGGRLRPVLGKGCIGDGGAERCRAPSTAGAVEGGCVDRDDATGGNLKDKFLRFLALRVGDSH